MPEGLVPRSKRQERLLSLAVLTVTSLLCLVGAELGLKILDRPFKGVPPSEYAIAQFDPDLGWSYLPDKATEQVFGGQERKIGLYFDRYGSRVEAPGVERAPERPTILFVGCSFTMGHGVTAEESAPGQLAAVPDLPFQVANFGVQGFGTDQSLLMLKRQLKVFNTKAVVHAFICDHLNRNANDDRRILFPEWRFLGTKPKFELEDGQLVQVNHPARYEDLLDLRLWGMIRIVAHRYEPKPTPELTRALLSEMKRVTDAEHIPLIVVDWEMQNRQSPCSADILDGLGLEVVRTQEGAPPDWQQWMVPGDPHPNPANHHRVAGLVLERLAQEGLVSGDLTVP